MPCLLRTILCQCLLQPIPDRVSYCCCHQRILVCHVDGDDIRLVIDRTNHLRHDLTHDTPLFARQTEGIHLLDRFLLIVLKETPESIHCLVPEGVSLIIAQILVIRHLERVFLSGNPHIE